MKKPLIFPILLVLAACSSGASLTGVGAFTPNTQYAGLPIMLPDGGPDTRVVAIVIAEFDQGSQTCADILDAGNDQLTGHALLMALANVDGGGLITGAYPISPEFPLIPGPEASLSLVTSDAGFTGTAVSGTVTLTQVGSTYAGSFTSTFPDNDGGTGTLTGSFSAPLCPP